jgi:D-cysteine desulfhydrase
MDDLAGLALGAALMNLPWTIIGVMLAGPLFYYEQQCDALVSAFSAQHDVADKEEGLLGDVKNKLFWVERFVPRKFGKVRPGEMDECRVIARKHGIVLDPIWTLSSWEVAQMQARDKPNVVMLHTGGALGLCGLAQRWPEEF